MITVVGMGFTAESLTLRGKRAIEQADKVIIKSGRTAPAKDLDFDTFDRLFEKAANFDELNSRIVDELIRLNEQFPRLVYCVDGDGYKDSSVVELSRRTEIKVIPGPFDIMELPATSCVYLCPYDLDFYPDPAMPICVYGIDDALTAGEVKLFLMRFFAPNCEVLFGTPEHGNVISLEDLDRQKKYSSDAAAFIQGSNNSSFADLLRVMARLTAPNGCPWDKAQTHKSIRINLLEEAYETVQAITDDNIDGMIEELGDVLLQVVFHADIAFRSGEFSLEDVIKSLNDKLIGRHTHIFAGDKAGSADGALSIWERNKMKGKHQDKFSDAVNDIPSCFPALMRAQKAAKRVSKGGWKVGADKLLVEICNKLKEIEKGKDINTKFGELLMLVAFLAVAMGGDCEQALLDEVNKIQRQYTAFENAALRDGKNVNELDEVELEKYFNEAKKA